jgi:hypothetical protein
MKPTPISGVWQPVQIDRRLGVIIRNHDIQPPIPIKIRHRHSPALLHLIATHHSRRVREFSVPQIHEQQISLPTVPRIIFHKPVLAKVATVLVVVELRDRAAKEW